MTTSLSILQSATADNPLASAALKALVERAEKAEGEAAAMRRVFQESVDAVNARRERDPAWRNDSIMPVVINTDSRTLEKMLNATAGRELLDELKELREFKARHETTIEHEQSEDKP